MLVGDFKQINVSLIFAICLLDTVYCNITFKKLGLVRLNLVLDRGFPKPGSKKTGAGFFKLRLKNPALNVYD